MGLSEKQRKFTRMLADLIIWAYDNGYEMTLGEAYRSDEQAEINAIGFLGRRDLCAHLRFNKPEGPKLWNVSPFAALADKIENNGKAGGIRNSLHSKRLAIDLMLFKDGVYLTNSEDYRPLGEFWESIGGTWGGRFHDGNHFSCEHEGIK